MTENKRIIISFLPKDYIRTGTPQQYLENGSAD